MGMCLFITIFSYNVNEQNNWIYLPMVFNSDVDLFQVSIPPINEATLLKFQIEASDIAGNKKVYQIENDIIISEFSNQILISIYLFLGFLLIINKYMKIRSKSLQQNR